jgi:hypothetical protein
MEGVEVMLRRYALVLGVILVLLGLLGFVPAIAPDGYLFGVFAVNAAHNLVHIIAGLIGIWAGISNAPRASLGYAWFVLILFGLLMLMGFIFIPTEGMLLGFVRYNVADSLLHLLISLSGLAAIVVGQRRPAFR